MLRENMTVAPVSLPRKSASSVSFMALSDAGISFSGRV